MKWQGFSWKGLWHECGLGVISCVKNICLKNQCNLGNRGLFWVPCVSHYRQLKCDFFSKLACTSRPITDHLPYLSYNWKYSKDYGRMPDDYKLFDSKWSGRVGDRWLSWTDRGLIPIPTKQVPKCLQFYCNCWYHSRDSWQQRNTLERPKLLMPAMEPALAGQESMICKNQSWYLSLAALVNHRILRNLQLLDSALVPLEGRLWITKESSVLSWLYLYNCVWAYILIMCI